MRFGVCVMANVDEIGFFNHVESLGFDSVWITDSRMLFATGVDEKWRFAEEFARRVIARV
jgi:hypothetical protein